LALDLVLILVGGTLARQEAKEAHDVVRQDEYLLVAERRSKQQFKGEASGDPPRAFWRPRGGVKMME
jgi:hypothetical protein